HPRPRPRRRAPPGRPGRPRSRAARRAGPRRTPGRRRVRPTALVYEVRVGLVIGLTLVAVCTMAASIGGVMPLVARKVGVDPAVFSNPFITTFVDATGLVLYFLIAHALLPL